MKCLRFKRVLVFAWAVLLVVLATDLALLCVLPLDELGALPYYDPVTGMHIDYGGRIYWYTPILSSVFNVAFWSAVALVFTSIAYLLVVYFKKGFAFAGFCCWCNVLFGTVSRETAHLVEVFKIPVLLALFMLLGSVVLCSMVLGYSLFGWVGVVVGAVLSSSWVLVLLLKDYIRQLRIFWITRGVEDGWRTPDAKYVKAVAYIVECAERQKLKSVRV